MSKLGKRLIKSAKEAVAIARGEKKPARIYHPVLKEASKFLKLYEKFTKKHWGPRCKDFSRGCGCCQAWKRYDREYEAHQ